MTDVLVARAEKIKIGDGLDESVDMGPLINQAGTGKSAALYRHRQTGRRAFADRRWRSMTRALAPMAIFSNRRSSIR